MPHQIDRTKTARQNFIDLVNTGSDYVFVGTEFTESGSPELYTGQPEVSNTQITLESTPNSGFVGTKTVYYRRLDAGNTRTAAALDFDITETDDLASLKNLICIEHNLVASEVNIVGDLPTEVDETTVINVFLDPFSLLYTGGTFEVNVTLVDI
jgi:hypothetical protein